MKNIYLWGIIGMIIIGGGLWWYKTSPSPITEKEMRGTETVTPRIIEIPTITYTNDGFTPTEITIRKGIKVVFMNQSDSPMWIASGVHPTHLLYPEFDGKASVSTGESYSFIFEKTGEHPYHNHLNPSKKGKVVVE